MTARPAPHDQYPLRYVAVGTRGNETGSTLTLSPADLAYALYKRRFKSATITRDGHEVGGVGIKDGKRAWWGES